MGVMQLRVADVPTLATIAAAPWSPRRWADCGCPKAAPSSRCNVCVCADFWQSPFQLGSWWWCFSLAFVVRVSPLYA